jgi:hypothetical protein
MLRAVPGVFAAAPARHAYVVDLVGGLGIPAHAATLDEEFLMVVGGQ